MNLKDGCLENQLIEQAVECFICSFMRDQYTIHLHFDGSGVNEHYEFQGFDEGQGGLNKVNLETAVQEAQNLNASNPTLEPSNGATFCNYATQNVLQTVASATDNSSDLKLQEWQIR